PRRARRAGARGRSRRGDRERRRRRRLPAGRHPDRNEREDDRDHQHRRGGAARPGRRAPLRSTARGDPPRRLRDPDRSDGARVGRLLRRSLRQRLGLADPRRRGRRDQRRPCLALAAPLALSPLRGLRLCRHEELEHPLARGPGSRRRVPARVRGRGALGPHRHGRYRLLHLASSRLPVAARRHRLRRPPDLRARRPTGRSRLNFDLTHEQQLVRDTVREFADTRIAPVAAELDREHRFPYDLIAEVAELGLMGMTVPEEYGGAGADTLSYAIAVEELTRVDSSVAITVAAHHSRGTLPIFYFGSEEQKREWLPQLASGERLAAFGLTEPGAGSDAGATRTSAELRNGEWVVNRSQIFITNAGTDITACGTITARTGEDEISNLIVPNGTSGYEISAPMHKLGWRASDTRELSFRSCAVPEGNLLGERGRGFRQFLDILDGGRISVAAMGVGLAQGAYDLAAAYAKERHQFGRPIASFQAIQFQLADMATEIAAGRQLVLRAAWLKDEGKPFALAAAQAKLFTGLLSTRAANASLQSHAG